jgi:flagella basal body P-ring formation protein FlgA
MIEEEVTQFLSTIHPRYSIAVENLQVPSDLFVPAGPIEISIDPPASITRLDGLSLRLEFRSEGQRVTSQWVRVNAVAQGDVVVIKKDVPYGRPLQESDVLLEAREFDRLESYFATEGEVIGCVTKRALFEGEILTSKDLKQPVLVNRGDVVTLLARGPSFVVSALGKSRDSGSQGDAVVIENLDSKQLVHATVVGKKTVEVVVAGGVR